MANTEFAGGWFVDSDGTLAGNVRVTRVLITPTSGASGPTATLVDDNNQGQTIAIIRCNTSETLPLDFSNDPIVFPNGLKVSDLSDCILTFTVRKES